VAKLADATKAELMSPEAKAVVGDDLRASVAQAVEQTRAADTVVDPERRAWRRRTALLKLVYVVGAIATATSGGVATSLLTSPEAAATIYLRLQPILDGLLSFFY
jgi:hypothetical protein